MEWHREIGPSRLEKDGQQYGLACWVNIYHVLNEKVNSNLLTPFLPYTNEKCKHDIDI